MAVNSSILTGCFSTRSPRALRRRVVIYPRRVISVPLLPSTRIRLIVLKMKLSSVDSKRFIKLVLAERVRYIHAGFTLPALTVYYASSGSLKCFFCLG